MILVGLWNSDDCHFHLVGKYDNFRQPLNK
jgi:hypothetical protein